MYMCIYIYIYMYIAVPGRLARPLLAELRKSSAAGSSAGERAII